MSAAIPWIATAFSAGSAIKQGQDAASASRYNAGIYNQEADLAASQGYEAEATQRRTGADAIGRMTAAAGQSGGGYGGSTGRMIGQSAVNAELDALNVRYKSQLQSWSYRTQSGNLRDLAGKQQTSGYLKAGAALLNGTTANYASGL